MVGAADCVAALIVVRLRHRGLVAARGTCLHALRPHDVEPARDVARRLTQHRLFCPNYGLLITDSQTHYNAEAEEFGVQSSASTTAPPGA